jgi:hypothetical protein
VQTLKWCRAYGIHPSWNLLYGSPGEAEGDYLAMAELVPLVTHLEPPIVARPLRLDRFSPLFEEPARFGITEVRPQPAYAHVYGAPAESLAELAYYFTFLPKDGRDPAQYAGPLLEAIATWKTVHAESDLVLIDDGNTALVCDYRPAAVAPLSVLEGLERAVYLACDSARSIDRLRAEPLARGLHASQEELQAVLDGFLARRLMIREGPSYLSLAVALEAYASSAMLGRVGIACEALRQASPA